MNRKTFIVTGSFGSKKYTWIKKTIKRRKKEFDILETKENSEASIKEALFYAELNNKDAYIVGTRIEYIPNSIIKKADKIKEF